MREIKFRAWDKRKKIMVYKEENDSASYWDGSKCSYVEMVNGCFKYSERYIWSQFTGLRDKSGKDVYEGDISIDWQGNAVVVEWKNELGSCGCCYDKFEGCGFINVYEGMEVIGNIHENPELLEAKP